MPVHVFEYYKKPKGLEVLVWADNTFLKHAFLKGNNDKENIDL